MVLSKTFILFFTLKYFIQYKCQSCTCGRDLISSWIVVLNTIYPRNFRDDLIFAITFTSQINKYAEIVSCLIF